MRLQDDYEVRLSSFRGPLDLLLFLVKRAEVDINDIPIAQIADQYCTLLAQVDQIDIDLAGEFLVMAATLIEIKSRVIAPPRPTEGEEGESAEPMTLEDADPRYALVRQLVAYQRFRTAADLLERARTAFAHRHAVRLVGEPTAAEIIAQEEREIALELEDASILDLFEAYERIVAAVDFGRMGDHRIEYDDTPISLHQEDLADRLARQTDRRMTLAQVFVGRSHSECIGLFLALLELARTQRIQVRQESVSDEIEIELTPEPAVVEVAAGA